MMKANAKRRGTKVPQNERGRREDKRLRTLDEIDEFPFSPPFDTHVTLPVDSKDVRMVGKALSSGKYMPHWMTPLSLLQSCSRRMKEGCCPSKKGKKGYPAFNWRDGLGDPVFLRERFNHVVEHMMSLGNGDLRDETYQGHVDAITWWCAMMNEAARLHPSALGAAFYNEPKGEMFTCENL